MLKLLATALLLISTPASAAEQQLVPTWMTVDAGAHKVTRDVVAGFDRSNSNWNFTWLLRRRDHGSSAGGLAG